MHPTCEIGCWYKRQTEQTGAYHLTIGKMGAKTKLKNKRSSKVLRTHKIISEASGTKQTHIKAKHPNKNMKEDYRGVNAGKGELR